MRQEDVVGPAPLRMSDRKALVLGVRMDFAVMQLKNDPAIKVKTTNAIAAKMILVALAEFHGQDGKTYPGIRRLARVASAGRATVIRAIRMLEVLGAVTITRRNWLQGQPHKMRTNWYVLNWERIRELNNIEKPMNSVDGRGRSPRPRKRRDEVPALLDQGSNSDQTRAQSKSGSGFNLSPDQGSNSAWSKVQFEPQNGKYKSSSSNKETNTNNKRPVVASQRWPVMDSDVSCPLESCLVDDNHSIETEGLAQSVDNAFRDPLPDGADPHLVKRHLVDDWGIGAGRAHKLAHHQFATIERLNAVLARAQDYRPGMGNKGAYVATLLDDALAEATRQHQQQEREAAMCAMSRREEIRASIDSMSDIKLAGWISKNKLLANMTPAHIRGDNALCTALAEFIEKSERRQREAAMQL